MIKKISALVLAGAMALSLAACGAEDKVTPPGGSNPGTSASGTSSSSGSGELTGLTEAFAEAPILLTTGGQSADYQMVGTLMKNLGMDYTMDNKATSAELGDAKTLIVVVGGSSKGLGAAGIDADQELARTDALLKKADELGITVVAMHTGGSARRGTLSDSFITPSFAAADVAVVVAEGDGDGLMSGILAGNSTPSAYVEQVADCIATLKTLFGVA